METPDAAEFWVFVALEMGESEGSPCIRAVDIYYETGF
jgi:hypothetical protein